MVPAISSRTLQRFFQSSPLPLTLASPAFEDCPLIMANEAFCELTGYAADDVIGNNCRFLQGPRTESSACSRMRRAITWQDETLVTITNYRRDGTAFTNLVFMLPIYAPSGRLLYLLGSQCDVSSDIKRLTPIEHAHLLDEAIELSNPVLGRKDDLLIRTQMPRLEACRQLLS